ncbi:MAG: tetratricopeptide repeat protein [Gammaproteobacteria bacterium]|nr:tetratricopeptide repeat protein [Gammaproteobacteria bacterium]
MATSQLSGKTWVMRLARCVGLAFFVVGLDAAAALCGGPLQNNNFARPLDYLDKKEAYNVSVVELYHFAPEVERLEKGMNEELPGDIDYVLMHIPNHYRALNAMASWEIRQKKLKKEAPEGVQFLNAACYFERALFFRPNDPTIHLIKGIFLHKSEKFAEAKEAYKQALALKPEYAEAHYNLGLLHFELKDYDEAVEEAKTAYDLGYPLRGLKKKLRRVGRSIE